MKAEGTQRRAGKACLRDEASGREGVLPDDPGARGRRGPRGGHARRQPRCQCPWGRGAGGDGAARGGCARRQGPPEGSAGSRLPGDRPGRLRSLNRVAARAAHLLIGAQRQARGGVGGPGPAPVAKVGARGRYAGSPCAPRSSVVTHTLEAFTGDRDLPSRVLCLNRTLHSNIPDLEISRGKLCTASASVRPSVGG